MIPRFSLFLLLVVLVSSPTAGIPARNPYPNELKGFKFYGRHLAPLRPFVSKPRFGLESIRTRARDKDR
jgi:hypothetical protein